MMDGVGMNGTFSSIIEKNNIIFCNIKNNFHINPTTTMNFLSVILLCMLYILDQTAYFH